MPTIKTQAMKYLGFPTRLVRAGISYDAIIGRDCAEGYLTVDTLCMTFSWTFSYREIVRVMQSSQVFHI